MELVAQAETGFDLAQSAADSNRRIVLAPGFALDEPLADQPVGEQHFVFGFRPKPDLAGLAQVRGRFDFKLVRGKADDAERGISARRAAAKAERSEERRVGKECVRTCRARWSRYHK